MKILHTADWHLGKRLDRFDRLPEQKQVLEEIIEIANRENPDVVLVAGDLFDTFNPPVEAVELLYRTLRQLSADGKRAVIAIAGNHDSPERVEVPDIFAREPAKAAQLSKARSAAAVALQRAEEDWLKASSSLEAASG